MLFTRRSFRCALLSLLLCVASIAPIRAQSDHAQSDHAQSASGAPSVAPAHVQLDDILASQGRARTIAQVAVSPDGKHIAWLGAGQIRFAPLNSLLQSQPVTAAAPGHPCNASDLAWSPDSTSIAFLSDCDDPGQQSDLFLSHLDGNPAHRITQLHGYVDKPAFSPDGKNIAFLYVDGATRPSGALAAETLPSGVIGEDHVEIQRVAMVSADSFQPGFPIFVTPSDLHVFEFDWSPDSKSLAYVAADPPGENNWWVAKLYTQPVPTAWPSGTSKGVPGLGSQAADTTNSKPTAILSPAQVSGALHGLQIALPRWSPDGKSIAFIGGLMSDQGATGGDVWGIPASGGDLRDLTPNWMSSSEWIEWVDDHEIDVSRLKEGNSELIRLNFLINTASHQGDPPGGSTGRDIASLIVFSIPGTTGDGRMEGSLSETADHSLAVFAASSFDRAPGIYAAPTGGGKNPAAIAAGLAGLTQLSHFNDAVKPSWGDSVSLSWTNDNFNIQGWLLLPKDYDPTKKYPLIVEVHGGPASSVLSSWNGGAGGFSATAFSSLGYFVFMPNPRGSYGQGEAFTEANRKDFGYGDLRDILAGVDTVLAKYPVDPNRVGIAGWSYGGFMTMFAVTQTHRFRAAVAGAGISDWLSYYGENSIDQWMIPYFGASVYDDPAIYAKSSAITYIKQANTPTLALVGDRDGECPAPQSFEFWHALRDLHVPAQLVVYPDEGHGFSDPADRRDVLDRAVDWFARYMPPSQ